MSTDAAAHPSHNRYWNDIEIGCVLHHVRMGLAAVRRGLPLPAYPLENALVVAIRGGARPDQLAELDGVESRMDAELLCAAVALMAGTER